MRYSIFRLARNRSQKASLGSKQLGDGSLLSFRGESPASIPWNKINVGEAHLYALETYDAKACLPLEVKSTEHFVGFRNVPISKNEATTNPPNLDEEQSQYESSGCENSAARAGHSNSRISQ